MLIEPLPASLDVRKAAARGAVVSGVLKPVDLARLRPLLAGDEGEIAVEMRFSRDDAGRYVVEVRIEADVQVECQRCLSSMSAHLSCDSSLAVVWTDEEAARLPRHLDALVETETNSNLREVVEDELILARQPFSYHDTDDCKRTTVAYADPDLIEDEGESKPNPFAVLGQLKSDK